jgi:hypothetical protein
MAGNQRDVCAIGSTRSMTLSDQLKLNKKRKAADDAAAASAVAHAAASSEPIGAQRVSDEEVIARKEARPYQQFLDAFDCIVTDKGADEVLLNDDAECAEAYDAMMGRFWKVGEQHGRAVYKREGPNTTYCMWVESIAGASGWWFASHVVAQGHTKGVTYYAWNKGVDKLVPQASIPFDKWHVPSWKKKVNWEVMIQAVHVSNERLLAELYEKMHEMTLAMPIPGSPPPRRGQPAPKWNAKSASSCDEPAEKSEVKAEAADEAWEDEAWVDTDSRIAAWSWKKGGQRVDKCKTKTGWFNRCVKLAAAMEDGDMVAVEAIMAWMKPQVHAAGGKFEDAMNETIANKSFRDGFNGIE